MGVEPFLIASTVRAVVGQRLVRRLCSVCKQEYRPEDGELTTILTMFNLKDRTVVDRIGDLESQAAKQGIGKEAGDKMSVTGGTITRLWRANKDGCDACNRTGYKGRMGIYEVLAQSESLQQLIVSNATSSALQDEAIKEGMVTMQIDGLIKALRGQTSIEEILRVTRE